MSEKLLEKIIAPIVIRVTRSGDLAQLKGLFELLSTTVVDANFQFPSSAVEEKTPVLDGSASDSSESASDDGDDDGSNDPVHSRPFTIRELITVKDRKAFKQMPLHCAAAMGFGDIVDYLLSEDIRRGFGAGTTNTATTALLPSTTIITPREMVEALRCGRSGTALHNAVHYGQLAVARQLIEVYGCDPHHKLMDTWPTNCLHFATQGGHVAVVKHFLEPPHSMDPTLDEHYIVWSPLHYAAGSVWAHDRHSKEDNAERIEIMKLLINQYKCDPHKKEKGANSTPLLAAVQHGDISAAKFLIEEHGCDFQSPITMEGGTPIDLLQLCVAETRLEMVEYLFYEKKMDAWRAVSAIPNSFLLAFRMESLPLLKIFLGDPPVTKHSVTKKAAQKSSNESKSSASNCPAPLSSSGPPLADRYTYSCRPTVTFRNDPKSIVPLLSVMLSSDFKITSARLFKFLFLHLITLQAFHSDDGNWGDGSAEKKIPKNCIDCVLMCEAIRIAVGGGKKKSHADYDNDEALGEREWFAGLTEQEEQLEKAATTQSKKKGARGDESDDDEESDDGENERTARKTLIDFLIQFNRPAGFDRTTERTLEFNPSKMRCAYGTPLHRMAAASENCSPRKQSEIVRLLVEEYRCDVDAPLSGDDPRTPIMTTSSNNSGFVRAMLAQGARVNGGGSQLDSSSSSSSPLPSSASVSGSTMNAALSASQQQIVKERALLTPLHYFSKSITEASIARQTLIVQSILDHGADVDGGAVVAKDSIKSLADGIGLKLLPPIDIVSSSRVRQLLATEGAISMKSKK